MNKYAISWNHHRAGTVYFVTIDYTSSDWDTYGSSPQRTIRRSAMLSEAKIFDTKQEVNDAVETLKKNYDPLDKKFSMSEVYSIVEVTDKQIFKAKLVEE